MVTLDGSQSSVGEWAVPHMHIWVQTPGPLRETGMTALRPARYRFRDWLSQRHPDGGIDGAASPLVPRVEVVVAFVEEAIAGTAPRWHSGESSGIPRDPMPTRAESEDAAPLAAGGLKELILPCEDGPLATIPWHGEREQGRDDAG